MKIIVTTGKPLGFTTVGYWRWTNPNNKGTLEIYVAKMKSRRHFLSVLGHELIEAFYCWLRGITTEQADKFDLWMEGEYESGRIPKTFEGGFHRDCPYRVGHRLGSLFERAFIFLTFGSWSGYDVECNKIMQINEDKNGSLT